MNGENPDVLDSEGLWQDDPGKMTLSSGRRVNPLTMTAADVDIMDIAHALARQCRYNGHVVGYLSVARHSLWVSQQLYLEGMNFDVCLAGLLHDAAEAYLGDMIRPLKHGAFGEDYLRAEVGVELAVFRHFGLDYPLHPAVTRADNRVLLHRELCDGGARATWRSTPEDDSFDFQRHYLWLQARRGLAPLKENV